MSTGHENPWFVSKTGLDATAGPLSLANRVGYVSQSQRDKEQLMSSLKGRSHSLRLINLLCEISRLNKEFHSVSADVDSRMLDKDVMDITRNSQLEKKSKQIEVLSTHLQSIVNSKEHLSSRLQQPYVGESLKIEATYHRHISEMLPLLAFILSDLALLLDTIDWAARFQVDDLALDQILADIASTLATLQANCHSVIAFRKSVDYL